MEVINVCTPHLHLRPLVYRLNTTYLRLFTTFGVPSAYSLNKRIVENAALHLVYYCHVLYSIVCYNAPFLQPFSNILLVSTAILGANALHSTETRLALILVRLKLLAHATRNIKHSGLPENHRPAYSSQLDGFHNMAISLEAYVFQVSHPQPLEL